MYNKIAINEASRIEIKNFILSWFINNINNEDFYIYVKLKDKLESKFNNTYIEKLNLDDEAIRYLIEIPEKYKIKVIQQEKAICGIIDKDSEMYRLIKFIDSIYDKLNEFEIILKDKKQNKLIQSIDYWRKNLKENSSEYIIPLDKILGFSLTYLRILNPSNEKISQPITTKVYPEIYMLKDDFNNYNQQLVNSIFKEKNQITGELFIKNVSILINRIMSEYQDKKKINTITKQNLNILLKGVPGTGKSRVIDVYLSKLTTKENIQRINIHSQSSNTDLMQGIGINLNGKDLLYTEKQGIILNFILKAICNPDEVFALVLEEIQENSLNELIGDLIYLIDIDKRVCSINIANIIKDMAKDKHNYIENPFQLINDIIEQYDVHYVTLVDMVEDNKNKTFKKLILPDNIYILCTTNYREDKKIIEDNLFRRFEVIDIFPDSTPIKNLDVREFFEKLNKSIGYVYSQDIHTDRYLIGQSNWIDVDTVDEFYKALIKLMNLRKLEI